MTYLNITVLGGYTNIFFLENHIKIFNYSMHVNVPSLQSTNKSCLVYKEYKCSSCFHVIPLDRRVLISWFNLAITGSSSE